MNKMTIFQEIYGYLKHKQLSNSDSIWIPKIWNSFGFQTIEAEGGGEILVNPYLFLTGLFEKILSLAQSGDHSEKVNLNASVIYTTLVRYSTAWDYNHDGKIEFGTLLRLIILLPILKKMGVNILYLLPITENSTAYKKGEIGAPFAVKNYFKLDPTLHDPLLNDLKGLTLEAELAVLVEASHLLGMKVVSDFIPRVCARNNDLIAEHPDWFYWIKLEYLDGFKPPQIPELGFFEECRPENLDIIYQSQEVQPHLAKFCLSPDKLNPQVWKSLQQRAQTTGEDLLKLIETELKITTLQAHSDWINDTQPVWTDITFLKLYMDPPVAAWKYLKPGQPSYILSDIIKSNQFPGEQPNTELWEFFEKVVRYYIEKFNFDGIRVDIGHALPIPLLQHLFAIIKELKPNTLLISEHLFNENHQDAYNAGYHLMLGHEWLETSRLSKETMAHFLKDLPAMKIPIFACAETPDTPRIVSRNGGVRLARLMAVLNHFMPNGVPFITTGFEANEDQPINCGLADNTNGAEIPRAFFNVMKINWLNQSTPEMIKLLEKLSCCKEKYLKHLKVNCFFLDESPEDVIVYGYRDRAGTIYGLFNFNMMEHRKIQLANLFEESARCRVLIDTDNQNDYDLPNVKSIELHPGQALMVTDIFAPDNEAIMTSNGH